MERGHSPIELKGEGLAADASVCTMGGSHDAQFRDRLYANRTYDRTIGGNADGNYNCDMDSDDVKRRDQPGRTTSGLDTTTGGKTGRHSGSNTPTTGSAIPEQKPIQHKASTTTTED